MIREHVLFYMSCPYIPADRCFTGSEGILRSQNGLNHRVIWEIDDYRRVRGVGIDVARIIWILHGESVRWAKEFRQRTVAKISSFTSRLTSGATLTILAALVGFCDDDSASLSDELEPYPCAIRSIAEYLVVGRKRDLWSKHHLSHVHMRKEKKDPSNFTSPVPSSPSFLHTYLLFIPMSVPTDLDTFEIKLLDHGVAVIAFNRPKRYNALNPQVYEQWGKALEWAAKSDDVRVVILTGNGKYFTSGQELAIPDSSEIEDAGGAEGVFKKRAVHTQ